VQLVPTYETTHTNIKIPITVYKKLILFREDGESYMDLVAKALDFYLEYNPRTVHINPPPQPEEIRLIPDTIDSERVFEIAMMSDRHPDEPVSLPIRVGTRTKMNAIRVQGETYDDVTNRVINYYNTMQPPVVFQKQPPPELAFNPNLRYLKYAIHESLENFLREYESPRVIQHTRRVMINPRGKPMYQVWYNGYAYTLAKSLTTTTIVDLLNKKLIQSK
jgi:hypothetical protein